MPYIVFVLTSLSLILTSCSGGTGSTIGGGNPVPTPPTVVDNPPEPGEEETVVIGAPGLCDSGDIARVSVSSAGTSRFSLVSADHPCTPAKDNRLEEYSMILFNTSESPIAFRIDSPSAINPFGFSTSNYQSSYDYNKPVSLNVAPKNYNTGPLDTSLYAANLPKVNSSGHFSGPLAGNFMLTNYSVGDEVEFRVLNSTEDENSFVTTSAILRAQGTNINLFVDRDIPIGVATNPDSPTQQYLDHAVEIFDSNTYPLVTGLLGQPSDIDNNSRINVLITPILNRDVESAKTYVDARNVMAYDPVTNPTSNESELIVLSAPDSTSTYASVGNNFTAQEYFKEKLFNGWLAFQMPKIISYNQKVLINGGIPEDDWIDDGVGAVMADLAGFNLFRRAAWRYLAAPQLDDLRIAERFEYRSGQGAEYLFMLYYIQAALDDTLQDTNANGFDDDLEFLSNVYASPSTSTSNLVAFVDVLFDSSIETEFDGLFKDWVIALLTSGSGQTALQQTGQSVLKYYLNENPLVLGSQINNASGSLRAGADGVTTGTDGGLLDGDAQANLVGLDLHALNDEDNVLFENSDEYVYAPGNSMNGYIDPFSAMYVRMSGLLTSEQSIGLFSSSVALSGFLVRRPDLTYPKTYHESIFGSINQLYEDLDEIGPNPFWENQGPAANAKRINLTGMIESNATENETSEDFVSIVGQIDPSQTVFVCPEDLENCSFEDVQDTDKYVFTVPDIVGRSDENYLVFTVRRRFDEGVDSSAFNPLLAIVTSKDVPYPYVPHPIRSNLNDDLGATDTRQQYRWLSSSLICGDDQDNNSGLNIADATLAATNSGIDCSPRGDEDSFKIALADGDFIENTGTLITSSGAWDGNIVGGECDSIPVVGGVSSTGYGGFSAYAVTTIETSGSSLGQYPWSGSGESFMEKSYDGTRFPKVLFDREFLKISADYPSIGTDENPPYDPRTINLPSLNCHIQTTGDNDLTADAPDDFLSYEELEAVTVSTLSEQILTEMSRYRRSSSGMAESAVLDARFNTPDVFVIDGDSRDLDEVCSTSDLTNNMNTYTVRGGGEGSILLGEENTLIPHISGNLNASGSGFSDQAFYDNDGGETKLKLVPGKSYTIIIGGEGGTVGDYEIRIRKASSASKNFSNLKDLDVDAECFLEL